MRLLFTGWYGYHNAGDDAFVYITDWQLKKRFPESEVFCLSPQQYGYGVQSVFLSKKMSFKTYLLSLIWYIPRMDVLIFSGGTLFKGSYSSNLHYSLIKCICRLFKVRMMAIGVSVGPFPSIGERNKWASYLSCFSFLALRDKRSYNLIDKMGLKKSFLGFDIACMLPYYLKERQIGAPTIAGDIIGISLCSFAAEPFLADIKRSLLIFFEQRKRCEKLLLLVFKSGDNGDKKVLEEFSLELRRFGYKCEVIDYHEPFSVIQNMNTCKMMICTRLHAGVFAYSFGIPFLMFEYEEKCTDFLNEIGKTDQCRIRHLTPEDIGAAYENVLSNKGTLNPLNVMAGAVEQSFIQLENCVYGC